ncbi:hypothetical protein H2204_012575 [Knufia peltigerae]|uniref:Uncharacterized protein n=1 Tax=Knufia peltigerae TaxID=1002370 RepID=A0AA38XS83_9EURO|nr:hypothetical protein H2204_012575 [Knufia peltigerae]
MPRPTCVSPEAVTQSAHQWCEPDSQGLTHVAHFKHLLRLARISPQIYTNISSKHAARHIAGAEESSVSPDEILKPGEVYPMLRKFHDTLRQWRLDAPVSPNSSSVYYMAEFYELHYQKERLSLLRQAIFRMPFAGSRPPDGLLKSCVEAAATIARTFDSLRRQPLLTYTRSWTHLIFSSGLVLTFAAFAARTRSPQSTSHNLSSGVDEGFWWEFYQNPNPLTDQELFDFLSITSESLFWLSEKLSDIAFYTKLFEALRLELVTIAGARSRRDPGEQSGTSDLGREALAASADNALCFDAIRRSSREISSMASRCEMPTPDGLSYDTSNANGSLNDEAFLQDGPEELFANAFTFDDQIEAWADMNPFQLSTWPLP